MDSGFLIFLAMILASLILGVAFAVMQGPETPPRPWGVGEQAWVEECAQHNNTVGSCRLRWQNMQEVPSGP